MPATTIKVSRELRDRLALRASAQRTTLAGAIERALDETDEQRFWADIHRENQALSEDERAVYERSGGSDDLDDRADDELSERGEW
ncbi:MAG: hypothetical protein QM611_11705 [Microbacterium sp.]|uniref:hypothetical protein n=1 Tax=Microbacterium sp. TaxID=51671 RepID=UPI0039E4B930